jgi:hypothetical protein
MTELVAQKGGEPLTVEEMHTLSVEVSGRERSFAEAYAEVESSADSIRDYDEMRSIIAQRYKGWTFDYIDNLDFDRIDAAWRGLCEKKPPAPPPELGPPAGPTWRQYLDDLLGPG